MSISTLNKLKWISVFFSDTTVINTPGWFSFGRLVVMIHRKRPVRCETRARRLRSFVRWVNEPGAPRSDSATDSDCDSARRLCSSRPPLSRTSATCIRGRDESIKHRVTLQPRQTRLWTTFERGAKCELGRRSPFSETCVCVFFRRSATSVLKRRCGNPGREMNVFPILHQNLVAHKKEAKHTKKTPKKQKGVIKWQHHAVAIISQKRCFQSVMMWQWTVSAGIDSRSFCLPQATWDVYCELSVVVLPHSPGPQNVLLTKPASALRRGLSSSNYSQFSDIKRIYTSVNVFLPGSPSSSSHRFPFSKVCLFLIACFFFFW